ncbi:aldolase/citrate lyase family protein [Phytoactinopolyspora mesophila]|uniref:CoA ester lyase n=1 Tax=Phytoactinopolyspora mesophila TaxID=2650750 RepID=A0A7K3MCQ6_9ACTN|nr:CoA ester lyase [Phytoactinopolyspora mesophila]
MTCMWDFIARARSLLFVPGDRPDRFEKAVASGADGVVLDIEDAVAPEKKAEARKHIRCWFAEGGVGIVRINAAGTPWHEDDVAALAGRPCSVMQPKITNSAQVADLMRRLPSGSTVLPLLETAEGILRAREICSEPGVTRAVFGNADLGRELGIDHADLSALSFARCQIVLASAASCIAPPIDGVMTALVEDKNLTIEAEHAASYGFTGKLCIHPRQVPIVNAVFTPSAAEIHWAQQVLAAAGDGSVGSFDNEVVGKPIVERARTLLSRAGGRSPY